MIITTTDAVEGRPVEKHFGIVSAEVIFGANIWKDAGAQVADVLGGRVRDYEKVFLDAREQAISDIARKAKGLGANAIVGVQLDFRTLGERNAIIMVAATGTAVRVGITAADAAARELSTIEERSAYSIDIAGQRRGPFSVAQLRELLVAGRLDLDATTWLESGEPGPSIRKLCSKGEEPS